MSMDQEKRVKDVKDELNRIGLSEKDVQNLVDALERKDDRVGSLIENMYKHYNGRTLELDGLKASVFSVYVAGVVTGFLLALVVTGVAIIR